jgi:hypothetical protein
LNNLDDEEKELDEKRKKLTEIKDILFAVIEEIDEAIGYESGKEKQEEENNLNYYKGSRSRAGQYTRMDRPGR